MPAVLRFPPNAMVVWLFASAILALMPTSNVSTGARPSSAAAVLRGLVDGVVAAATLPAVFTALVVIIAAVVNSRDARRRDPVRRFTRQRRRAPPDFSLAGSLAACIL
ncbi:hypothetical protein M8J71_01270 [Pseudarthrobacter sp. R1]|uniref:hypothetical protein n=1 Tax=Pseudarthrobacter sp. R1 TaxID=2944934 RepID=UPI00210C4DAC|nr:hypothetical protein [Pseudarthrobacter sp. R1]MCQ6269136.1 hypothetical protein [Pseudarthrobacter sp. R1]